MCVSARAQSVKKEGGFVSCTAAGAGESLSGMCKKVSGSLDPAFVVLCGCMMFICKPNVIWRITAFKLTLRCTPGCVVWIYACFGVNLHYYIVCAFRLTECGQHATVHNIYLVYQAIYVWLFLLVRTRSIHSQTVKGGPAHIYTHSTDTHTHTRARADTCDTKGGGEHRLAITIGPVTWRLTRRAKQTIPSCCAPRQKSFMMLQPWSNAETNTIPMQRQRGSKLSLAF
jgi:hypothetical protein